jgi:hypothetical protein
MSLFNDVFNDDAFGFVSLSAGVSKLPFIESRLGQLGLFSMVEGVETDTVVIDETEGQLQVLTTKPRGSDPEKALKEKKAKSRAIKIPHLQFEDRVMASSLLGKRMPGMDTMQTVAAKINDRFQFMLNGAIAPTLEIHRLNALRGILLDSDGTTVIHDYFSFFGVSQITHNFAFSVATTAALRLIEDHLGGIPFAGVRALCGRNFFDALTSHPKVRDTFIYQESQNLRGDLRHTGFNFGGIVWEEYRGMRGLTNNLGQVPDDEAIMYPEGVNGMLRTYYAPADFLETVDQLGQPLYARVAPDWKYNRWVDQLMETNPLFINCRPRAVLKVTKS